MRQDTLVKLKETFNWVHERSRELRRVDMKMAKTPAYIDGRNLESVTLRLTYTQLVRMVGPNPSIKTV